MKACYSEVAGRGPTAFTIASVYVDVSTLFPWCYIGNDLHNVRQAHRLPVLQVSTKMVSFLYILCTNLVVGTTWNDYINTLVDGERDPFRTLRI